MASFSVSMKSGIRTECGGQVPLAPRDLKLSLSLPLFFKSLFLKNTGQFSTTGVGQLHPIG